MVHPHGYGPAVPAWWSGHSLTIGYSVNPVNFSVITCSLRESVRIKQLCTA
jgi:hypothetical protein